MATVFIVDDDTGYRELIRALLEEKGHVVADAVNGLDALKKLEAMPQAPDLFIMDLRMPELGGYELTMRLREIEKTRQVPIVLLTGSGQGVRDLAEREGVTFLQKLVASNNEIIDHVERLLRLENSKRPMASKSAEPVESAKPLEIDRNYGASESPKTEPPARKIEPPVPKIEPPAAQETPKESAATGPMDRDKFDELVLALLWYNEHVSQLASKSFDWDALNRLFQAKLITNPQTIRDFVNLSAEGAKRGRAAFLRYFGKPE